MFMVHLFQGSFQFHWLSWRLWSCDCEWAQPGLQELSPGLEDFLGSKGKTNPSQGNRVAYFLKQLPSSLCVSVIHKYYDACYKTVKRLIRPFLSPQDALSSMETGAATVIKHLHDCTSCITAFTNSLLFILHNNHVRSMLSSFCWWEN